MLALLYLERAPLPRLLQSSPLQSQSLPSSLRPWRGVARKCAAHPARGIPLAHAGVLVVRCRAVFASDLYCRKRHSKAQNQVYWPSRQMAMCTDRSDPDRKCSTVRSIA